MPDALSSVPFDHVTLRWRRLPGNNPHFIVTLINIMPLIKFTRYYTFNSNIYYLFTVFMIYFYVYFLQRHTIYGIIPANTFFSILK